MRCEVPASAAARRSEKSVMPCSSTWSTTAARSSSRLRSPRSVVRRCSWAVAFMPLVLDACPHASACASEPARRPPPGASGGHELAAGGWVAAVEAGQPGGAALGGRAVVVARGDVEVAHGQRRVDRLLDVLRRHAALREDGRAPGAGHAVGLQLEGLRAVGAPDREEPKLLLEVE